ncbi:hypothetical protein, partial [Allorhizocola rhizosphaerae]|uniref:hypothetical protein n=1 Tax=Allorhizocola rhizosphaerae TaxID=1872709 RepID=UPI001FEB0BF2
MSVHQPHGGLRPAQPGPHTGTAGPLTDLIAVASAPAEPGPLPGEDTVMAAYRAAQREPTPQPRRPSMIQLALAKIFTVKAAIAACIALAGGVAVATTTGIIPDPLDTDVPTPAPAHSTRSTEPSTSDSPTAALYGLCTAYLAAAQPSMLDTPAYGPLVAAAGGKDHVTTYCTGVTANPPAATPTPSHPTGAPT